MNRRVGLAAIQKRQQKEALFKEKSDEIAKEQLQKLKDQMEVFRNHLQVFAGKHKKAIRKNPDFRRQFQEMCATVGVDPLQSSNTFWSKLLGVGDFYYEIAIQVIEICMATSHYNGGIITIDEVLNKVKTFRNSANLKNDELTVDDILRAINKLNVLGNGLKVVKFDKTYVIESVATELSMDHNSVLQLAQTNKGCVQHDLIVRQLNWSEHRVFKVINDMIMQGIAWVDTQSPDGKELFWFPGLS
ncbi:RNA polymerase II transcription factor complex subunit-like protein [Leptotrombidium deliense]|uniref:Vacuolar-sorting protein SNF8 n=1 Tax=Leptotrombidium deliense TaxID=299467 RepID=A0A443S504_9ACAR|nr:RNA polymerase II transcription factor complex subunit-like protein [Leptotrombidium deliense]